MKVLFVATVQSHIGQFHMPFIRELKKLGHTVEAACKDNTKQKPGLDFSGIDKFYNIPFERNPYSKSNINAYKKLKQIIDNSNYDIAHCHTPVGSILTRLAARDARKKGTKVIYTAHGFHFYKGAPKKNWMLYYPIEKYCAKYTDLLLTMNTDDYELAKKKMPAKKVEYIPGVGVDIDKFTNIKCKIEEKRKELGISKNAYLLISVGELNKNKNYKVVIDALAELKDPNIYYIIAGVGPLKNQIKAYIEEMNVDKQVQLIGYRRDIPELFKASDLVIQPSFREGLPLTVMEAIASKTDIICSNIRGCKDLVPEEDLFSPTDSSKVAELIKKKRNDLNSNIEKNFLHLQKFSVENVNRKLLHFYSLEEIFI